MKFSQLVGNIKSNSYEIVAFTPDGKKIQRDLTIVSLENARRIVDERIMKPIGYTKDSKPIYFTQEEKENYGKTILDHFKN